jgi:glyceraldehyde-3-phosphate dehydrogenase/erythrose-4-phosphate dehydrogenase
MAAVKVGINGFGRIGRLVFRALVEQGLLGKAIDVVAVNDLVLANNLAYLLKYDSTQGRFKGDVACEKSSASAAEDDVLIVNGHKIKCLAVKEGPAALPWKSLGVEYVIECTGLFTDAEKAKGHLQAGAKRSSFPRRRRTKTSRSSWASTTRSMTPPGTTSSPTPVARPTASRRSFMCFSRKGSASKKA